MVLTHVTQGHGFKYFWSHTMLYHDTLPLLHDECYESSLIEDLVCMDIDDGSLQEELHHWPPSLLVPR